ncbi:MAG: hypothetical protein IPJ25_07890 [Rhodocyclaceae bacterium]|nr:hypothetical protein [Rhodocyclaceae bacterium]
MLTTASGSTVSLTAGALGVNRVWGNSGVITKANGGCCANFTLSGTLNNLAGGVFTLNDSVVGYGIAGAGIFNNSGTFNKTQNGAAVSSPIAPAFNNLATGMVNLNSGTLTISGALSQAGTIEVASGTTFQKTGSWTNNGTIRGSGTVNLGTGNTLTNSGTISPGVASGDNTATLSISGNLTNTAAGIISMELSSPVTGDFDLVAVSGTATLQPGSTLNLSGLTAASGAYVPLTAGTLTGTFSTINSPDFTLIPTYTSSNLSLAVTGTNWILWDGGGDGTSWGSAGNWSTDTVPTSTDNVLIDVVGTPTITLPSGTFSINRISSTETFTVSGGTLAVAGVCKFSGLLTLSSGALTLNGAAVINGGLSLSGGTLIANSATTATTLTQTGGTLGGTGTLTLTGTGSTWSGSGTSFWSGDGIVRVANGADLTLSGTGAGNSFAGHALDILAGERSPSLVWSNSIRASMPSPMPVR